MLDEADDDQPRRARARRRAEGGKAKRTIQKARRCPVTDKVCRDQVNAEEVSGWRSLRNAINGTRAPNRMVCRPYKCPHCEWWHVTSLRGEAKRERNA